MTKRKILTLSISAVFGSLAYYVYLYYGFVWSLIPAVVSLGQLAKLFKYVTIEGASIHRMELLEVQNL